jgi:hypothetical protein
MAKQPERVADEDLSIAVKAIRGHADGDAHLAQSLVIAPGMQLPTSHPIVKAWPSHFVPVVPPGRTRANSVRALSGWTEGVRRADGSYEEETDPDLRRQYGDARRRQRWVQGQYVDKDLPEVQQYPSAFEHL